MERILPDISEQELRETYKILDVKPNTDDIKLLKRYLKLFNMYSEGIRVNKKSMDKAERIWDAYNIVLKYRLKEKYNASYKLEDRSIVLSLPTPEFFKDPIKQQFMSTTTSDYAKICGGGENKNYYSVYDKCATGYLSKLTEGKVIERKSKYWLKGNSWSESHIVDDDTISKKGIPSLKRNQGVRPIAYLSSSAFLFDDTKDYYEIEYGEYPQALAPTDVALELELAYRSGDLLLTGKNYIKDSNTMTYEEWHSNIIPEQVCEFYFEDKKYVRVEHNILNGLDQYTLSDGARTDEKDIYWVEVLPVKWIVFPKDKVLLSKYTIMGGLPYNVYEDVKVNELFDVFSSYSKSYLVEENLKKQCNLLSVYNKELIFEMTDIFMFLNKYMKDDLFTIGVMSKLLEEEKVKQIGGMH